MRGGHAVFRVVEDLQLDDGWRGRPRPTDDVLGALAQVHDQHPDDHQPPAHKGVEIPDPEGEEEDVEGNSGFLGGMNKQWSGTGDQGRGLDFGS